MVRLIFAEKPDAAKKIAGIIGAKEKKKGYFEGNGFIVTYGIGHLVRLADTEDYGYALWSLAQLPIIPTSFKLKAKEKEQLEIVGKLFNRNDIELINATDPDREGELLFRYVHSYVGCTKPFKRLWLNTFTEKDVKQAFENLRPSSEYDNLGEAAKARSESDWLVGINGTQTLSLRANKTSSLGRVQTPTLAIICKRYLDNKNFKPTKFWRVFLEMEKDNIPFKAETELVGTMQEAESIKNALAAAAVVTEFREAERLEKPPLLYDLSDLQQAANRRFGFSAAQTDALAQSLYQKGVLSYPRTDSKFIGKNLFNEIPQLLKSCSDITDDNARAYELYENPTNGLCDNSVNDEKVTGHHALLPSSDFTLAIYLSMGEEEKRIMGLVMSRMFEAFYPDGCIKKVTNITFLAGKALFFAKGIRTLAGGWRNLYPQLSEKEDKEKEVANQPLPSFKNQEEIVIKNSDIGEHQTKAEPLFTEASLIGYMKSCGNRELTDDELKKALNKVKGIGRPATRSGIIETLFKREYIKRENGKIVPTDYGLAVYSLVKGMKLSQVKLTAEWESRLDMVAEGKLPYSKFMEAIKKYTADIVADIKKLEISEDITSADYLTCPECKQKTLRTFPKGVGCTRKECDFVVWRKVFNKELTDKQLVSLIDKGKTAQIKFKNKDNKEFSAALVLVPGGKGRLEPQFPATKKQTSTKR